MSRGPGLAHDETPNPDTFCILSHSRAAARLCDTFFFFCSESGLMVIWASFLFDILGLAVVIDGLMVRASDL